MKRMIICLILLLSLSAYGADSLYNVRFADRHLVSLIHRPDSADVTRLERKSFWRAAGETFGFNMGLWAFDRYVQKGHYAYISLNTIRDNFRHGFEWDNDYLGTNMFAHPYNGSLFYNAGRSNGFNFWQSELFAIGGSAMWELFMECEYPSTNDIIATPVGGAAIGEVLYRTSDMILDDRAYGTERFGRELAAFIVDPMRGFTRLVTGRAWEHRATRGRHFGMPPVSVEVSLGCRLLAIHGEERPKRMGGAFEIDIEYGDCYAPASKSPYDYFSLLLELNAMRTQPLLSRVEIVGRLLSRDIADNKKVKASVGMYQHFDYFDSDTISRHVTPRSVAWPCVVPYKFGTPASIGVGLMARYTLSPGFILDSHLHVNGVILAGILTDFYRDYHRNYNWGSGFSIKGGVRASLFDNKLIVSVADQLYRIYTWNGYDAGYDWSDSPGGKPVNVQGDSSKGVFNHFEGSVKYRLWGRLYLAGGVDFYRRITDYYGLTISDGMSETSSPKIVSTQVGAHLMLSYTF